VKGQVQQTGVTARWSGDSGGEGYTAERAIAALANVLPPNFCVEVAVYLA